MQDFKIVLTMAKAFTIRFFRNKIALFFTFLFPLIFLIIFGLIFGSNQSPSFKTVLINRSDTEFARAFEDALKTGNVFKLDETTDFDMAKQKLGRGEIDGIIELPKEFGEIREGRPAGELVAYYDQGDEQLARSYQAVLQGVVDSNNKLLMTADAPFSLSAKPLQTANLTRFDYTLAGLIGFSMMTLGIFSVSEGFTIDKKNGALRRLRVAPIKAWQVIVATAINRIFIGLIAVALMYITALIAFNFNMRGDYISFVLFSTISLACMFGFGMAIAGWARDANQAAPVTQLITLPMMFLSGVFFPTFLMPEWLQKVTIFIPLTPIIDGLRYIMTEGKTILEIGPQLGIIAGWTVLIYLVAFKVFNWE